MIFGKNAWILIQQIEFRVTSGKYRPLRLGLNESVHMYSHLVSLLYCRPFYFVLVIQWPIRDKAVIFNVYFFLKLIEQRSNLTTFCVIAHGAKLPKLTNAKSTLA